MDDFADVLLSSHKCLKRKDCVPLSDTGYWIIYGHGNWSAIQLEVAFKLDRIIVRKLFIRPDLQGQGIGRTIVEYLKRESKRLQISVIELYVVLRESREFWERSGFDLSSGFDGCNGRWVRPEE